MTNENKMSKRGYWENRDKKMKKEINFERKMTEINNAESFEDFTLDELQDYIGYCTNTNKAKNEEEVAAEIKKRQEKTFWEKWTKEYFEEKMQEWNKAVQIYQRKYDNPGKIKVKVEERTGLRLANIKKAAEKYKN